VTGGRRKPLSAPDLDSLLSSSRQPGASGSTRGTISPNSKGLLCSLTQVQNGRPLRKADFRFPPFASPSFIGPFFSTKDASPCTPLFFRSLVLHGCCAVLFDSCGISGATRRRDAHSDEAPSFLHVSMTTCISRQISPMVILNCFQFFYLSAVASLRTFSTSRRC